MLKPVERFFRAFVAIDTRTCTRAGQARSPRVPWRCVPDTPGSRR